MPEPSPERAAKGLWWDRGLTLVDGCHHRSLGCADCWSAAMYHRLRRRQDIEAGREPLTDEAGRWTGTVRPRWNRLGDLDRGKPRVVAIWNDLLHPDVPIRFVDRVLEVIDAAPHHVFVVLTKRPERLERALYGVTEDHPVRELGGGDYVPSLILGVTCESNEYLWRVEELMKVPAAVRFVNAHLLGPLDLADFLVPEDRCLCCGSDAVSIHHGQHWVTPPGEPNAAYPCGPVSKGPALDWLAIECNRPFRGNPAEWWGWCRDLVEQADAANVAVWVKQGPLSSGTVTHRLEDFPEWARRREFPNTGTGD